MKLIHFLLVKSYQRVIRKAGISDFHRITVTVMKRTYENIKPEITNYKDYKNFCKDRFQQILWEKLFTENTNTNYCKLGKFLQICINNLTYLLLVRKNTQEETIWLSLMRIIWKEAG